MDGLPGGKSLIAVGIGAAGLCQKMGKSGVP